MSHNRIVRVHTLFHNTALLGVPWCQRAQAILTMSSFWPMYASPWLILLQTLVMAETMAWLVVGLSVKGTVACILLSSVWTGGLLCGTVGTGGVTFSWLESLSLLVVGLSGWGKVIPAMLVDLSSQCYETTPIFLLLYFTSLTHFLSCDRHVIT